MPRFLQRIAAEAAGQLAESATGRPSLAPQPVSPQPVSPPRVSLPPRGPAPHTAQVFLDSVLGEGEPGVAWMMLVGGSAAGLGSLIAYVLFRSEASLVAVFLTALGTMPAIDAMLVRNRNDHQLALLGDNPDQRLARSMLALFGGAFLAFALVALVSSPDVVEVLFQRQLRRYTEATSLKSLAFGSMAGVLTNNALVLMTVLLFAIVYRAGGLALVLLWNASVWGAALAWIARLSGDGHGFSTALYNFGAGLLAIGPHLILEALGYVLAAMAGVAIIRGVVKGGQLADSRKPVVHLVLALSTIVLGACIEAALPEMVLSLLL